MRRFRADHETVIPDETVVAWWPLTSDTTTNTRTFDSSYSARYTLLNKGGNLSVASSGASHFFDHTKIPTRLPAKVWAESVSTASAHLYVATDWSLGMWWQSTNTPATRALIEYSVVESPAANADLCPLGVYALPDGTFRLQWDLSTTSLAHTLDVQPPVSPFTGAHFWGITKTQHPTSARFVNVSIQQDGQVFASTQMVGHFGAARGANGLWQFGSSRRWGATSGASPGMVDAAASQGFFTDYSLWGASLPPAKMMELYRNARRSWNERRMLDGNCYRSFTRVLVEDGDGNMVDLSNLYETNWVKAVSLKTDVDTPEANASVKLMRQRGTALNLSPLAGDSILNLDSTAAFDALLDLRRKIRIEAATVPNEWRPNNWEYETVFDGFINKLSWGAEEVAVDAIDKMATLKDLFQIDPQAYNYYDAETLAETHIQSVINNNAPRLVLRGASGAVTTSFAFLGLITPVLYTPASSGWVLRYDDTPSGNVDTILRSVSDQIGWDLRYRWHEPHQDYRLTFYEPPRNLRLDIASISADANGFTNITFTIPHRLTVEQALAISGTVEYDTGGSGTITVDAVLSAHTVRTSQVVAGPPAAETVGVVVYSPCYTFKDIQVARYNDVNKNVDNIRNSCIVKFQRVGETASFPITLATGGSGSFVSFDIDATSDGYLHALSYLQVGQTFKIEDCDDTDANATFSIGSIGGASKANRVTSAETVTAPVSGTEGTFSSDYISFQQVSSCQTVSISKYGYKASAIFEGSSGAISTVTEAMRLAQAVVLDLADPTVDTELTLVGAGPWFELHDVLTLSPDKRRRWSTDLTVAVTGLTHDYEAGQAKTTLRLRNAAPTLGTSWAQRINVGPYRPGIAVANPIAITVPATQTQFSTGGSKILGGRQVPAHQRGLGGKARLKDDSVEVHVSTNANFVPEASTLAKWSRDNNLDVDRLPDGSAISPGTTYYIRYRHRDIFGNMSVPSTATTLVARHTDRPVGAKIYRIGNSTGGTASGATLGMCQLALEAIWMAYPFNDDTSSPAYDTFSKFTPGPTNGNILNTSSARFQMPCDGTVLVQGRMGFWNDGISNAQKYISCAVRREGSLMPGSASTLSYTWITGPTETGEIASQSVGLSYYTLAGPVASPGLFTGSPVFVPFNESVTAHSGDYIRVMCQINNPTFVPTSFGVWTCNAANTSSISASWVKFTVLQD